MNEFLTAVKFSTWALEGVVLLPPLCVISILATISLAWAGIKQRPFRTRRWKAYHWFVIGHLLFFAAAIAIGVFGANPSANPPTFPHPPIPAAVRALDIVMYGSIASCGFWIWRMKGFRWFAVSLMLLAEAATYSALFIAGMAVSGDWL